MRYKSYKPSGVAWLGEIPEHWEVKPLRSVLQARNEKNDPIKTNQILSLSIAKGVTLYSDKGRGGNKSKSDLTAYKLAYPDDIVMNSMNVIVGAVGLSKYFGAISPVYYALHARSQSQNIHFYDKIFSNRYFQSYLSIFGKGILIKESSSGKLNTIRMKISMDDLKKVPLPLPPLEEQESIVRYLNFYEHKINKAIHVKKKLIATLSEQKQAIIAHAVTKGVDLHVKMKESGIPWLGEIPEHWEVKRGKALFKKINRPVLKDYDVVTCFRDGEVTLRKNRRTTGFTEALKEIGYQGVNKGDLVIHAMDAFAGAVGVSDSDGKCSPVYAICLPIASVVPKYYALIIREMARIQWILALSKGIRERSTDFRFDMFGAQFLPVPPCEEQKAIVEFIEQETATIDKAIELSKKEIELLEEYKTRLIADVVTGAMDVREEAQNLPQIEEDSTAFESDVFEAQEEEISDE
jgi:type I restriction enzyme S subunit